MAFTEEQLKAFTEVGIAIGIIRADVSEEVAKATDYRGSKLSDEDNNVRERVLAGDEDLQALGRLWTEAAMGVNERFKRMLVANTIDTERYDAIIEVSKQFDRELSESVEAAIRGYFIASMIGGWYRLANKSEAADYMAEAEELLTTAERLLYSRKRPKVPKD